MSLDALPPVIAASIFSLPLGEGRLIAWFSEVISKGPAGKFEGNSEQELRELPGILTEIFPFESASCLLNCDAITPLR